MHNKLLPNLFTIILFQSVLFILIPQDYPLITTCSYQEENVLVHLLHQKCGLQYQTILNSSATFTFKWKLKKHVFHEKDT